MNEVVIEAAEHAHIAAHLHKLIAQFIVQDGIHDGDVRVRRILQIFLTELNIGCQCFFNNAAVGFNMSDLFGLAQCFSRGRQFQRFTDFCRQ